MPDEIRIGPAATSSSAAKLVAGWSPPVTPGAPQGAVADAHAGRGAGGRNGRMSWIVAVPPALVAAGQPA